MGSFTGVFSPKLFKDYHQLRRGATKNSGSAAITFVTFRKYVSTLVLSRDLNLLTFRFL